MQLQQRHGDTHYYVSQCASESMKDCLDEIQTTLQVTPPGRLNRVYGQLFNNQGPVFIEPDFFCQTPEAVSLGAGVFFNHNCSVLGKHNIIIGDGVLIGPNVIISARALAGHCIPDGPIVIEDNVWIGANALILAGAHIQESDIIGAGARVNHCVSAGSSCINGSRYRADASSQL